MYVYLYITVCLRLSDISTQWQSPTIAVHVEARPADFQYALLSDRPTAWLGAHVRGSLWGELWYQDSNVRSPHHCSKRIRLQRRKIKHAAFFHTISENYGFFKLYQRLFIVNEQIIIILFFYSSSSIYSIVYPLGFLHLSPPPLHRLPSLSLSSFTFVIFPIPYFSDFPYFQFY